MHLCDIVVYLAAWLADRIWGQILKWPKSPDMGFESAYPISSSTISCPQHWYNYSHLKTTFGALEWDDVGDLVIALTGEGFNQAAK